MTSFSLRARRAAHQQIVGHELRQVDLHPFQDLSGVLPFITTPSFAFRVATEDQRRGVTACGRYGQRIHIGHGAAVKLPCGVLVDGFDIVVELHNIDFDVFAGPIYR